MKETPDLLFKLLDRGDLDLDTYKVRMRRLMPSSPEKILLKTKITLHITKEWERLHAKEIHSINDLLYNLGPRVVNSINLDSLPRFVRQVWVSHLSSFTNPSKLQRFSEGNEARVFIFSGRSWKWKDSHSEEEFEQYFQKVVSAIKETLGAAK